MANLIGDELENTSIHILTRRMTARNNTQKIRIVTSIHILTRRMTRTVSQRHVCSKHFNPHPHMEDDFQFVCAPLANSYFNPHPHMEDDISKGRCGDLSSPLQSTSSHGG